MGARRLGPLLMFAGVFLGVVLILPPAPLVGSTLALQQVLTPGRPEDVGVSAARLDQAVQLYRDAVDRQDVVGVVMLVAKDGKVVLHEALGWRNVVRGLAMEKNTLFRMASNTKPVVATAVSMLVEEGKLSFRDPVGMYIPAFESDGEGDILIHHLLSHTSGLRIGSLFMRPYSSPSARHPNAPTLQSEVERFEPSVAGAVPGRTFSYSNAGYNILGAVVEIVSGQPLEKFLDDRLYAPLGMHDTYHYEVAGKLEGKLHRMGAVYSRRDGNGWAASWEPGDPAQVPFVRGSGGMVSTALDYATFCQMFLNGGSYNGVRVLSEHTAQIMIKPQDGGAGGGGNQWRFVDYGYGWIVTNDRTFLHTGFDGTAAIVDPNHNLVVLAFTQTQSRDSLYFEFLARVRAAIVASNDTDLSAQQSNQPRPESASKFAFLVDLNREADQDCSRLRSYTCIIR